MDHYGTISTQNSHTSEFISKTPDMLYGESPTAIILAISVLTSTMIGSITKFVWVILSKSSDKKNE